MTNHQDPTYFQSLYTEELYRISPKTKIVITRPWSDLTKEEKDQLSKITEALRQHINPKLSLDAIEIVVAESPDLSLWSEKPEKLIYFGSPVKGLNPYEVITVRGTKMVLSETLSQLIPNESSRSKLWLALKQLFTD